MSQVVKLELSDEVYAALKRQADSVGVSLSEWIAIALELQSGLPSHQKTQAENKATPQEFSNSSHSGAIDVGYLTGSDNRGVDADLVGL
ncbi:MAG: hypothetical protein RIB93_13285 [Coleofasciculus sp. D1-CHI-01]|uniref:hypothetical protein n=1 Tax=Coleofasciculus sp. D1-CHI-01 TaxID=3068482 RepID=UPI003302D9CF